jgi:hypothetical protein
MVSQHFVPFIVHADIFSRKFISKRIPPSEKQSSNKSEKERGKSPSRKSPLEKPESSGRMTGPKLAALYQLLKQQAEELKTGDNLKAKNSSSSIPNGGHSRGESSKSALS